VLSLATLYGVYRCIVPSRPARAATRTKRD
jgi:hypothetical protein